MNQEILLTLSLILSSHASDSIASQQILSKMYTELDFDPAKRLLIRLLPLLSYQQRDFLKSLS